MTVDFEGLPPFDPSVISDRKVPAAPTSDGEIVATEGHRNDTLARDAGYMRRRGFSEPEVLAALVVRNRDRIAPSLPDAEVHAIVHSVCRYSPDDAPDLDQLIATLQPQPPSGLRFMTPAELSLEAGAAVTFVVQPYLIAGAITDFIAPAKKGKTRLRNHMIRAAINGTCCLGCPPCAATPVVLLTEEPVPSLMEGLRAAGLTETEGLSILTLYEAREATWVEMVTAARVEAERIGAKVLFIDTMPAMAGLAGDAENQSGPSLSTLRPLQEAAGTGLAVATIRHTRKAGGGLVDAGRGSSAWAGGVDVIVRIDTVKGARPTVRRLEAIGRFAAIPPVLTVERVSYNPATPGDPLLLSSFETYEVVTATGTVDPKAADELLAALPNQPGDGLTTKQLHSKLGMPETTVRHALDALGDQVTHEGTGTRGDPRRFYATTTTTTANPLGLDPCRNPPRTGKEDAMRLWLADERAPPSSVENDAPNTNP